ncbi:hypothetical protein E2562_016315 [Oryza meyeriana var. granulata]|uniref:Uncharacterized protein n=1 Tax=Oryza meyeriana var. granulata TaxID=110450 RepID=A0A6G1DZ99_9ORYZ|nr:hypothetical protein E2562_016315 [Oryza meyeriana var. granulata]
MHLRQDGGMHKDKIGHHRIHVLGLDVEGGLTCQDQDHILLPAGDWSGAGDGRPSATCPGGRDTPFGTVRHLLIRLDMLEDWSLDRSRTGSSGVSGLPSSPSSDSDDMPRPHVRRYVWNLGYADGTLPPPPVAAPERDRPDLRARLDQRGRPEQCGRQGSCRGTLPPRRQEDDDDDDFLHD